MINTIEELSQYNSKWFTLSNKRFFQDVDYWIEHDKNKNAYLIQSTYGWSDMCGGAKILHYRIHNINEFNVIDNLFDEIFKTKDDAINFIKKRGVNANC